MATTSSPRVLAYLRKVDPFVFEEMLLCAFDEGGFEIQRNWRYTGDGGNDGQVTDTDGNKILVQAKRYARYVKPADVEAFSKLVRRSDASHGVFVHTGRTGPRAHYKKGKAVTVISGTHLVRLLLRPGNTWLPRSAMQANVKSDRQ